MADNVGLIRPGGTGRGYQGLAGVTAVEPPHWMLVRASQLIAQGWDVKVVDLTVDNGQVIPRCDTYEVWPSGNHPSAMVQEREGVGDLLTELKEETVRVMDSMPNTEMVGYSPAWDRVDVYQYRAHNWHTWGQPGTVPYGTVHTSVSCPFSCDFCSVKGYYGMGYWVRPVVQVVRDLKELYNLGVRNIKIMDELFVAGENRLEDLYDGVHRAGFTGLNMWAYGRVDTLGEISNLSLLKGMGVNWIGLGIESGNEGIRVLNGKGTFTNRDVVTVVRRLKDAGIGVAGNFIFGFPQDNKDTLRETWELAYALQCEYANFYCMVAYPGTPLEVMAKEKGWYTPKAPLEYAQYSSEFHPLQTENLPAEQVLAFRDWAYTTYNSVEWYRNMIRVRYGDMAERSVRNVGTIALHRELLGGTQEEYYARRGTRGA